MSLQACAEIVERGDPDRFLATMAAPPGARGVLFPLYAFNIEVSRAPWVTEEPMIAEMRLQWWRDALDEIAAGGPVRSHEVTLELARVLDAPAARALDRTVAARRWDIYKDPFEDAAHFEDYLDATAAELMWQAVRLLGGPVEAEHHVRRLGHGTGLVRFLQAVPELEARGRIPLVDGRAEAIRDLARASHRAMGRSGQLRGAVPSEARAGLLEGWQAPVLLRQISADPARVAAGRVALSPFRKKLRLMRWA
ncbi:phytoene/squalene synthase family protein [Salibaculum sp.]|uniref:phytoene/squalene synthase family protein n=1 Tax=Salibaculum sp. TaxID=2855480 RepID=UPI002B4643C1|nr:squalene/phytoene synthase family protein [Salibaculum sp.]HKL70365.1 squalene/phytoene synthase family protein [Salibaculum sp.]